jgi:hypothetical protein
MLYSNTNGAYPDLNFFFAPFCIPNTNNKNTILNFPNNYINSFQLNSNPSIIPFYNNYNSTNFWPNQFNFNNNNNSNQNFIPKIAKVQIIKKNNENNNNFIQNENNNNKNIKNKFNQKSKKLFSISSSLNNNNNNINNIEESTNEFSIDNISIITNDEITKFNTDSKLKKIHSTYHLKRKFTTKLQNDVKDNLNKLIAEINMNMKLKNKLPFISPNSKQFREDIKIESLKKNKNLTIGKYISEEVQNAERSLNNNNNYKVIQKIEKMYENYNNDDDNFEIIKKLYFSINKTIVFDYYEQFLKSERFKKCFEKDLMKYHNKIKNLKFSKEKIDLYCEIFKEKYEGIAKSYFTC